MPCMDISTDDGHSTWSQSLFHQSCWSMQNEFSAMLWHCAMYQLRGHETALASAGT